MTEWISVKDRLPQPKRRVLVFGDDGIFTGYRDDYEDHSWNCYPAGSYAEDTLVFGITHWMPLSEEPE